MIGASRSQSLRRIAAQGRGFRTTTAKRAPKPNGEYGNITIGVPKETLPLERRVSQTPGETALRDPPLELEPARLTARA